MLLEPEARARFRIWEAKRAISFPGLTCDCCEWNMTKGWFPAATNRWVGMRLALREK